MTLSIPASATRKALLPTGRLRAAINFGNPVLAQRNAATGAAEGVSVDLAHALATVLEAELEIRPYTSAGKVTEDAARDSWDIAFLAIDPLRAEQIAFTNPYVIIEGTYLVAANSPYQHVDELDAEGVRIAVGQGAAYDLYLSRNLRHASLHRAATSAAAVELYLEASLEAAAGVRQPLELAAKTLAGQRVLSGHFTAIRQAMATPRANATALPFLQTFIEARKADGFVAAALARSGQGDATVAPAADAG